MATVEALMAVIGASVDSTAVRGLVAADGLVAETPEDLEEGVPPSTSLSNPAAGYELVHCEGRITTAFLYAEPHQGFAVFPGALPGGLMGGATRREVLGRFGVPDRSGPAKTIPALGRLGAWDRFVKGRLCVHFQYTDPGERIRLVTIMDAAEAP